MRANIDQAGRVVIPKPLRDAVGLVAGEVELTLVGTAKRIEAVTGQGTIGSPDGQPSSSTRHHSTALTTR